MTWMLRLLLSASDNLEWQGQGGHAQILGHQLSLAKPPFLSKSFRN